MGREGSFGGRGRAAILQSLLAGILLAGPAGAQSTDLYPLEEVRPGQRGYGKTVFQGNKVEKFDVEILGVLEKFEPRRNLILVRVSGGQLDRTGVFAGMSGSPVYIEDKLVGAIAYSFPFAKEPIAGVTPIQETVDVFKETHRLRAPPAPERPRTDISARGKSRHGIRPSLHPGGLRCDSGTYSRYAPESRLVRRAQERSRCSRDFHHGLIFAARFLLLRWRRPAPSDLSLNRSPPASSPPSIASGAGDASAQLLPPLQAGALGNPGTPRSGRRIRPAEVIQYRAQAP